MASVVSEYAETLLVQYTVAYQPDQKQFRAVADPQIYETQYRSPQLTLWQFGDDERLKLLRLPPLKVRRQRPHGIAIQQRLFV